MGLLGLILGHPVLIGDILLYTPIILCILSVLGLFWRVLGLFCGVLRRFGRGLGLLGLIFGPFWPNLGNFYLFRVFLAYFGVIYSHFVVF